VGETGVHGENHQSVVSHLHIIIIIKQEDIGEDIVYVKENIFECGVKHHNTNSLFNLEIMLLYLNKKYKNIIQLNV
jgi:hypothetical protein